MDRDDKLFEEVHRLATAAVEGTLSPQEQADFEELIQTNPEARQAYGDYMLETATLRSWASSQPAPANGRHRNANSVSLRSLNPWQHPVRFGIAVATLTVVCWLVFLYVFVPRHNSRQVAEPGALPDPAVAVITGSHAAMWAGQDTENRDGQQLYRGDELQLDDGLAEIIFRTGVHVVVEGPAVLQLSSLSEFRLDQGAVSVKVPEAATGFTVNTPVARVVDLGTEFGVAVAEDSGASDVHVFVGKVRLEETRSGSTIELTAGQSARISLGGIDRVRNRGLSESFVRSLPRRTPLRNKSFEQPLADERVGWTAGNIHHWQFEGPGEFGVAAGTLGYARGHNRVGGDAAQYAFVNQTGKLTAECEILIDGKKRYELTVALGHRDDHSPGTYRFRVLADGEQISATDKLEGASIPAGTFQDFSLEFDGQLAVGKTLTVQLEHTANPDSTAFQQGNFDNVRLFETRTEK